MKLPSKHWIVILSLALLSICGGLWTAWNRNEPKYQGKTAEQWFEARLRGEALVRDFDEAVITLNTNFIPVLLNACGRSQESWSEAGIKKLPTSIQKRFRKPVPLLQIQNSILECAGTVENVVNKEIWLDLIKENLRDRRYSDQIFLGWFLRSFNSSKNGWSLSELSDNLRHKELCIRLTTATYVFQLQRQLRQQEQRDQFLAEVHPVFEEALTYTILMTKTFGSSAQYWQKEVWTNLNSYFPHTAQKYTGILK